jgi:hypothetical protein
MPSAWPTTTELSTQLERLGLDAPSTTILQAYLDAAVAAFEKSSGWNPFLATGTPSARYFDPPVVPINGKWLLGLLSGCVSITSVYHSWDATASTGTLLAVNTGYLPWAYSQGSGMPYTEIEFLTTFGSGSKSIRITADWGYGSTVPSDVWLAVLKGACGAIQTEGGALARIKQGPVEMEFAPSASAESWADEIRAVASRYRREDL